MSNRASSKRWLKRHFDDEYVQRAQKEGYRSRAVYKLIELDQKYRIFKQGMTVIDLGAAPGSWAQYAASRVTDRGTVIATDILEMDAISNVTFIQGDFRENEALSSLLYSLHGKKADLVISDMAPNISGTEAVDTPRSLYLVELALDMATKVLKVNGGFVCKLFQGEGSDAWLRELRQHFRKVMVRKPKASRAESREVYIVAHEFKGIEADCLIQQST